MRQRAGHAAARARAWPGQGVCRDTNIVSWIGAALCHNRGSDTSCDTAQDVPRYGTVRAQHSATRHVARDSCRDTKIVS